MKDKLFIPKNDKLDAYRKYLIQGGKLSDKRLKYLSTMKDVLTLLSNGFSKSDIVHILENDNKYSGIHQGYKVIRDTIAVFGDVSEASREGQKFILAQNFQRIATACRKLNDLEGERKALEAIAKLYGLFDAQDTTVDVRLLNAPRTIVFSSDPAILRDQQEIEEGNYELNDLDE